MRAIRTSDSLIIYGSVLAFTIAPLTWMFRLRLRPSWRGMRWIEIGPFAITWRYGKESANER